MAHSKGGVAMDDDVRPLYDMIDSRRQALGMSWPDVVQRCGYINVSKGMRRLDAIWDGKLRGKASAHILTHLANALELDDDAVQAAITLAQDQLDSTREKAERAVFEPSAYLQGTETIPSQITIFGMTGGAERWLRIPLDLTQPPDTFVSQAMPVVCETPITPFFGYTTGFVINYTYDKAILYDTEGRPVREFDRAYTAGVVTVRVGGRDIGTNTFSPSESGKKR